MNENIIISKKYIEKIPVLYVKKESDTKKEIIVLLHKLLNDKVSELSLAYQLAAEDYFVIILDIRGHGERNTLNGYKYNFQNMFVDARETVADIKKILRYTQEFEQQEITLSRIGVIGTSFGASIALIAGYMLQEINYVVCLIGTCNLRYFIENKTMHVFRPFSLLREIIDYDQAYAEMEALDCLKNYHSENLKPMLFLDGIMDTTIPYKEKVNFYQELEAIFSRAKRKEEITYQFFPHAGHKVNASMVSTLLKWLRQQSLINEARGDVYLEL